MNGKTRILKSPSLDMSNRRDHRQATLGTAMSIRRKFCAPVIVAAASYVLAFSAVAAPCDAPAHRSFDFWLGTWQVRTPDGKLQGVNKIEREYDGCVLHERYQTGGNYRGESLNMYDAGDKRWHQTWVDNTGTLLLLEGGIRDGKMVMEGQTANADGVPTRHRISWTPNADGSVRQLWESTDAKGQWTTAFDGLYTRQ